MIRMQAILNGERPSKVFRDCLSSNEALTKYDLSAPFMDTFPEVNSIASQVIWAWRAPESPNPGMADDKLDDILLELLFEAGYFSA